MIFHAEKRSGFLMVSKEAINDPRLSLKAKGLLCYLLSKPPDWVPRIEDICNHCCDGRDSVQSGLKELQEFGYAVLLVPRSESGKVSGREWSIFESPSLTTERPKDRKTGFRCLSNTEGTKNEATKLSLTKLDLREIQHTLPYDTQAIVDEALKMVESRLGHLKGTKFWDVWVSRATHCPIRTAASISWIEEEEQEAKSNSGNKRYRRVETKNVGGKCDYFFRNPLPCYKLHD
jgi:hypothetical protein